jgi:UrcA family protein
VKIFGGIVSTVLIGGASLSLSSHAVAGELKIAYAEDGAPTTTVSFSDLDLSKPADVQTLYARVQEAAVAVCDAELRAKQMASSGWRQQCIRAAVAGAGKQVDDEWLAILLRGMPQRIARL